MNCCGGGIAADFSENSGELAQWKLNEDLSSTGRTLPDGTVEYVLNVPAIQCGACISTIERGLRKSEGVVGVRVNLTLRRVTARLDGSGRSPGFLIGALERLGYQALPFEAVSQSEALMRKQSGNLLKALAVAGFAAANIMLLSVSVWSGAEGATRDLFHFVSALLALPAIAYSGRIFFVSAWQALRGGQMNMDVPISLGVLLATGMSLYETFTGGPEAYFDAAVTLLFFLLAGRYLDQLMRERARSAVTGLARLASKGAIVIGEDEALRYVPVDEIKPGDRLRVAAGERVAVDGVIINGSTDLDRSLVTGESAPAYAAAGQEIEAGTLNLTGPFDMRALRGSDKSFLAEVLRMMEAAETGRGRYVRIADRIARMYAPAVHVLALSAFIVWMIATGDWHSSIYTAISVLIVTCPCALGLAVPVVHVIGAGRLFEHGILMRDGSALERLAEIDRVVFDKTGTLTSGTPQIVLPQMGEHEADIAGALAGHSVHPASRAVAQALCGRRKPALEALIEVPGFGVAGRCDGKAVRLGRADWVAQIALPQKHGTGSGLCFAVEGGRICRFGLSENLREDAKAAMLELRQRRLDPEIVSGDSLKAVADIAHLLGVERFAGHATPQGKIDRLAELAKAGHKVLMIGDGLNDAPALAAGHVSMAPAAASDAGRQAADFVFTRESMMAVVDARDIAMRAQRLVRQNFMLAIAYNFMVVPVAFAGMVTPLLAAIAMSASSVLVIANSMRLAARAGRGENRTVLAMGNLRTDGAMA